MGVYSSLLILHRRMPALAMATISLYVSTSRFTNNTCDRWGRTSGKRKDSRNAPWIRANKKFYIRSKFLKHIMRIICIVLLYFCRSWITLQFATFDCHTNFGCKFPLSWFPEVIEPNLTLQLPQYRSLTYETSPIIFNLLSHIIISI